VAIAEGFIGEEIYYHFQVVATNNYNITADFHTKNHSTLSSQSTFTSFYLVTALHNDYSSALFSLLVSW
jgi:hypothetical protein